MPTVQQAVEEKYGRDVLEAMQEIYDKEACQQSDDGMPGMRDYFLTRAETSPQGDQVEKHPDSTEAHMFDMLCKLVLYAPEEWYETVAGRRRPAEFTNDWKNIGVAFDASSRLRRAGVEYYHKIKTLKLQIARSPPFDAPCVFFLDPAENSLKMLPITELPKREWGKVRVVSVSDTHLLHRHIFLPPGDLLVHAGDLSYEESRSRDGSQFDEFVEGSRNYTIPQVRDWFKQHQPGLADALKWLGEAQGFRHKVLVGGNHDYILEQLGDRADEICSADYGVHYLRTNRPPIQLQFEYVFALSVWGSGVSVAAGLDASRAVKSGNCSFQVDVASGDSFLSQCEHVKEADVMVTHTPPVGVLLGKQGKTFDAINKLIERVKPKLYVCGHAHNEQDLLKGRHAEIGDTVGVNAACVSNWNYLHGLPVVVDVQPQTASLATQGDPPTMADFDAISLQHRKQNSKFNEYLRQSKEVTVKMEQALKLLTRGEKTYGVESKDT